MDTVKDALNGITLQHEVKLTPTNNELIRLFIFLLLVFLVYFGVKKFI